MTGTTTGIGTKPGTKTATHGGVAHWRHDKASWFDAPVQAANLRKSVVYEGEHDLRSAFFDMKAGESLGSHPHIKWVQVAVFSGRMRVEQDGVETFYAEPGEVYFINPGVRHNETAVVDSLVLVTQGEDRAEWIAAQTA